MQNNNAGIKELSLETFSALYFFCQNCFGKKEMVFITKFTTFA